jgi:tRNA(Arg) A34 adenosine deaminase TadA
MSPDPARLLSTIEEDILPLTRTGVAAGNKVFGAAILRRHDLSCVIAGTNNETANPLWHGEIHCLKLFHELPDPPDPRELFFLSTHEPCSMCLSAITWAGFSDFAYFFSHQDSRDAFAIPHDLRIMEEVFGSTEYRRKNAFWTAWPIMELIGEEAALLARAKTIREEYARLSADYQSGKDANAIPLA